MKVKKIVIFLIVAAALGGGLYLFQKDRQSKALIAHNTLKFQQLTKAAEKSSSAGLLVMASAINKYHQVKGRYPEILLNLYPEFIPDKAFISTLNWKYYPETKKYLIKKNVAGKNLYASMGPDLRLQTGIEEAVKLPEAVASLNTSNPQKTKPPEPVAINPLKPRSDINGDPSVTAVTEKVVSPGIKTTVAIVKPEEKIKTPDKPAVTMVRKELDQDEKFLLSFDGARLYIWKTRDGIIGFSNVEYPVEKQLTIYRDRTWIEYGVDPNNMPGE